MNIPDGYRKATMYESAQGLATHAVCMCGKIRPINAVSHICNWQKIVNETNHRTGGIPKMIDWQDLLDGYNDIHKTNFPSIYDMLYNMYFLTGSMDKIADVLGVSASCVRDTMDKLNVPRRREDRRTVTRLDLIRAIPEEKLELMDVWDVAREAGCAMETARSYLGKLKRNYLKYRGGRCRENKDEMVEAVKTARKKPGTKAPR